MIKYLLLFASAVLTSCITSSNINLNKKTEIKGDVLQIIDKQYETEFRKGEHSIIYADDFSCVSYFFNQQNSVTKREFTNAEGKVYWYLENTYDDNENLRTRSSFFEEKLESTTKNIILDNKVVETVFYNEKGEVKYSHIKEYKEGEISRVKEENSDGKVVKINEYEWDDSQLISIIYKDLDGQVSKIIKYERNSFGDVIKKETESPKNEINDIVLFEYDYDHKGNWIKKYHFSQEQDLENVSIRNIFYSEDENINVTKEDIVGEWFMFGTLGEKFVFKKDNSFLLGSKKNTEIKGTWSYDARKKLLTLIPQEKEKNIMFGCSLKGGLLHFYNEEIGEILKLEKREPLNMSNFVQEVTKQSFLKKWTTEYEDNQFIEFQEDNQFVICRPDRENVEGKWKVDLKTRTIIIQENGKNEVPELYFYFKNNQLKLFNSQGKSIQTFLPFANKLEY